MSAFFTQPQATRADIEIRAIEAASARYAARGRGVIAALVVILLLGLFLRGAAARGDLWIDEVWTLSLVSKLEHPGEIFWNLSHDNNHFLNSLWMYAVGLDGAPWAYRLPSIVMGVGAVAVAARIGFRSGITAGLVCAFAFAISYPMVNFGSEARGYSGLILMVLVAVDALDLALPSTIGRSGEPSSTGLWRQRWRLGAAIGIGTLSHLIMVSAAVVLGLVALWEVARHRPRLRSGEALRRVFELFWPSIVLLLPALAAVATGLLVKHGMTIGGVSHAPHRFVTGYGRLLGAALGLPSTTLPWLCIAAALAGLYLLFTMGLLHHRRGTLIVVGLLLVPGLVALANPPNTEYPRYFLCCGVYLTLILAEGAGKALARPSSAPCAAGLLLVFTAGQAALDHRLLVCGRGEISPLADLLAAEPAVPYAATFSAAFQLSLDYQAYRRNVTLHRAPMPWPCGAAPGWYIEDAPPDGPAPADTLALGPDLCRTPFALRADAPTSPLSGRHWTLYRRLEPQP